MNVRGFMLISLLLLVAAALLIQASQRTRTVLPVEEEATALRLAEGYGSLPLSFEANQGQTDPQVKFLSRGGGYTLFLTLTEAVLALRKTASPPKHATDTMPTTREPEAAESTPPAVLRMKLVGSNPAPQVVGLDELPGKSNYFIGNDPEKWRTNVPSYRKVAYREVYPGIDLVYYGTNQGQLEYDFIVAPGADPKSIALNFEGADKLEIDPQGNLIVHLTANNPRVSSDELPVTTADLRFHKPRIYQPTADSSAFHPSTGTHREIPGNFALYANNQVAFEVGPYDSTRPLIIDPVLSYSTYLGGSDVEIGRAIAVDSAGSAYVTGVTASTNFPTVNPLQPGLVFSFDAFVAKLNATGSALVYSTYLGGGSTDQGSGIAVDDSGNAYVTGETFSTNFPTTAGAFDTSFNGGVIDVFVTKLNAAGSALLYSTYLGGSGFDPGLGIAVDAGGNAYVTGQTLSTNFPTASPLQATLSGVLDVFVTKLNAAGSALVYSTYLGGSGGELGRGIAVDAAGNAYVTGVTTSPNYPTVNAFQATFAGGVRDVFVTKLNAAGSALVYSTYLGGSGDEQGFGIAVDGAGNAYVTGFTASTNFPTTTGAFQTSFAGGNLPDPFDAFVTKVNTVGSGLLYSTFVGGSGGDRGLGIAVDPGGNAYVTGQTFSTNFPGTAGSPIQPAHGGVIDVFVTKLNAASSALVFSTYLGGGSTEQGFGIAVDGAGNAYVTGITASTNFPTANPLQAAKAGVFDAFVAKIGTAVIEVSIDVKPGSDPNAINPAGRGLIPVAILTTGTFDATTMSPITVQFGPAGAGIAHRLGHLEDVDSDGDLDLVLHFRTQGTGIQCGDTEASLTGETFDGQAILGTDSIVTVGCS